MTLIKKFYDEKQKYTDQERILQETIRNRQALILSNDEQYKSLLIEGKEEQADELFAENTELKTKQRSESAKLGSYKQIHEEALNRQALEVLDNDLLELKNKFSDEYKVLLKKEDELKQRLQEMVSQKLSLDQEIKNKYRVYSQLADEFNLRKTHKARFNKEPYSMINNPQGRILEQAQKKLNGVK